MAMALHLQLIDKKAFLRTKEEEYKFLGENMTLVRAEFCHWKGRLTAYKRRSKFGQLMCELSSVMRNNDGTMATTTTTDEKNDLLLHEFKKANKRLEIQLDNKIKIQMTAVKEKIIQFMQVYEELRDVIKRLEDKKVKINLEICEKERQLQAIDAVLWNPLSAYGKEMTTLKKILDENSNEFIKAPKGPLGTLISVKLANWVSLVEYILEPYLYVFLVDNKHDKETLEEYIGQVYGKYPVTGFPENLNFLPTDVSVLPTRPEVWVAKFSAKPKDFSKTAVKNSSFPTLMDIIEFQDNDVIVKNALGEFSRFEKILLYNNEHEAFGELSSNKRLPKNCLFGYTKEFFKIKPYPQFSTTAMERRQALRGMLLKPTTKKTSLLLRSDIEKLARERDEKFHPILSKQRANQLEIVYGIEYLNKKCDQLKRDALNVQKTSKFVDSLYEEIFSSNPSHLASRIMQQGAVHEEYFLNAREAAVGMALIAKKQYNLERIIGKLLTEISKSERAQNKKDETITF